MAPFFFWWLEFGQSDFPALSVHDFMVILFLSPLLEAAITLNTNHSILTQTLCSGGKSQLWDHVCSILFTFHFKCELLNGQGCHARAAAAENLRACRKDAVQQLFLHVFNKTYTGTFGSWADDEVIISALK